jgi:hypothetical protein
VSYQCAMWYQVIPRDRIIVLVDKRTCYSCSDYWLTALLITNRLFCHSNREYEVYSDWLE